MTFKFIPIWDLPVGLCPEGFYPIWYLWEKSEFLAIIQNVLWLSLREELNVLRKLWHFTFNQ